MIRSHFSAGKTILLVVGLAVAAVALSIFFRTKETSRRRSSAAASGLEQQITRFCGDCHAFPSPDTFPVVAWEDEVLQGYEFYTVSGRSDLDVPPFRDVIAWYRERAPDRLTIPVDAGSKQPSAVRFRKISVALPQSEKFSAVSHIRWVNSADGRGGQLLFCDMSSGDVRSVSLVDGQSTPLSRLSNPAHLEPTDLDGDRRPDYVVADLGSLMPADHRNGQVIWLRQATDQDPYASVVLQDGLARVADVQPGDFDNDGDIDLVVAEFGWRATGRILLLERRESAGDTPEFLLRVLDDRHGSIHVPAADLNGDGFLDFVALVSQEHEVVDAYLNRGDATFQRERIFAAGDPSYGSSGIQLIDMDSDGDLDVLYTNGDTVDSFYLKPYHAIHWLENQGSYPFRQHLLATMPGVYRAVAGDVDGDGDTDIAACAYFPIRSRLGNPPDRKLDTLIWLEQTQPGSFRRRSLSTDFGYVALELADFDQDGDTDLAVGNYFQSPRDPWVTIWLNLASDEPPSE